MNLYSAQSALTLVLGVMALLLEIAALVDAARTREDAFRAAGKMTKSRWLIILGLAVVVGFIFVQSVFGLVSLAAVIAAGVYFADVRPALQRVLGRSRNDGPYGPW